MMNPHFARQKKGGSREKALLLLEGSILFYINLDSSMPKTVPAIHGHSIEITEGVRESRTWADRPRFGCKAIVKVVTG